MYIYIYTLYYNYINNNNNCNSILCTSVMGIRYSEGKSLMIIIGSR